VIGGTPPYTWYADFLPDGLSIDSVSGKIVGTPTTAGTTTTDWVQVSDKDNVNFDTKYFSLTINPMKITTTSLPDGTVGVPYDAKILVNGGTAPYIWAMSGLPDGLDYSLYTGEISGTPTTSGKFTDVEVAVLDKNSINSANQTFSLTINPLSLTITSTSLPAGTINVPYSTTMTAKGGTKPYAWSATGLPGTLNIDSSSGEISGTPTTSDTYTGIMISVTDNVGTVASINVDITINSSTLTILPIWQPAGGQAQVMCGSQLACQMDLA
jgi:hypothetical protein